VTHTARQVGALGVSGAGGVADPLRIGVLGAARITEPALVVPAREASTRIVAIAARDPARAAAFAERHGVENVLGSYAEVIACPEVEAVYNPLPNGWHTPWNLAAIAAGKHVLAEKPFATDAGEAADVAVAARHGQVVVMEAMHYAFHPVARRLLDILSSGEIGELRHVETIFEIPPPPPGDLRWSFPLAGGAVMDVGCYCLHAQRAVRSWGHGEPVIVEARAGERAGSPQVDEWFEAVLRFPTGATGFMWCGMAGTTRRATFRITGTDGDVMATDFVNPQYDDRVIVRAPGGTRAERLGTRPTYSYQLDAFVAAIRHGAPVLTSADDAIATMRLIDQCYLSAGLPPRRRSRIPRDPTPKEGEQ
jgi:predicted dehydrogenase